MKQGWEIKKFGEVCSLIADGDWIESRHQSDDGIRLIQTGNIGNGVFRAKDDKPHYISESTFVELGCTEIFAGDCLVSRLPDPVGRACIIPETNCRMITAVDCSIIRFNSDIVSKFFIYYTQCEKYRRDIDNNTTGTTRKRISRKNLESICIPIPPREEQERIVAELDCLSGVIERKREQLRELDALAQSIFYQMFGDPITNEKGWEVKKIKDIFSVKIGPFGSLLHNSDYISGGTPLVNPIHMHNERICPDFDFTVSDDKLKELGNYILHIGDIVLARRGDIGRCALVGENEDGYLCGTGSLFIRPIKSINSEFVISLIRCSSMIECLTSLAKGATMLNINCKIVEDLNIVLPPLALQQEFADKIEAIEKQKELIKQSISKTEELFNSRMDYYFN